MAGTWGIVAYCSADWNGSRTPACAQAQAVSPEQSKAMPGLAVAKR